MSNQTERETQRRKDKGKGGMIFFRGSLLKEIEEGETGRLVGWGQGGCTCLCTTGVAGGEELRGRGGGRKGGISSPVSSA